MTDSITASELAEWLKSAEPPRLLDVRELEEFDFAALSGAKLLPLGQIPACFRQIEGWKDQPVVVYCHHGIRSLHAIQFLRQVGFTNLLNLRGGIDAWSREVDPRVPRY